MESKREIAVAYLIKGKDFESCTPRFFEIAENENEVDYLEHCSQVSEEIRAQISILSKQIETDLKNLKIYSVEEHNRRLTWEMEKRKIPSMQVMRAALRNVFSTTEIIRKKSGRWKLPEKLEGKISKKEILEQVRPVTEKKKPEIIYLEGDLTEKAA